MSTGSEKEFELVFVGLDDKSENARSRTQAVLVEMCGIEAASLEKLLSNAPFTIRRASKKSDLVVYFNALKTAGAQVLLVKPSSGPKAGAEQAAGRDFPGQLPMTGQEVEKGGDSSTLNDGDSNDLPEEPPLTPDELFKRASDFMHANKHEEAGVLYLKLLAVRPGCFEAHLNLGNTLYSRNRFDEAIFHYRETLRIKPECTDASYNIANTLCRQEKFDLAIVEYKRVLELKPGHVQSRLGIANALYRSGKKKEASDAYQHLLERDPSCTAALLQLGNVAVEQGDYKGAEHYFRRLLSLNPNIVEGYFSLGNAYKSQNKNKEAIIAFKQALTLKADFAPALTNLGYALLGVDRVDDAISAFRKVLALSPDNYETLNNLGNAYFAKRDPDEGVEFFNRAVELRDKETQAHWNRSLTLLLSGDYKLGWQEFEWRLKGNNKPLRTFAQPAWDGSDPRGKTILIYLEQGFGDCFHCLRYVPLLVKRGARVLLEYRECLKRLLTCIKDVTLVSEKDHSHPFHYHAAIMSLPHLMGTTMETIPAEVPYLKAPESADMRYALGRGDRPKVGLVWKGNPHQGADRFRSSRLECFVPLLNIPDVDWVCLQQIVNPKESALLEELSHVKVFEGGFGDYADTAYVISQLDLVISVDTGLAHLSGAMAKPVWLALSQNASWQWLLEREDSPWYPTARLFRQKTLHKWDDVIEQISRALKQRYGIEQLPSETGRSERLPLARKYYLTRNFLEAEKLCTSFSPAEEEYPEARHLLGLIASEKGRHGEAVALITEAIALSRDNYDLQNDLGVVYMNSKRFDLARLAFQRSLESNPDHAESYECLAALHFEEGDYQRAKRSVRMALKLAPETDSALLLLGRILRRQGRSDEALKTFRKAMKRQSPSAALLIEAAHVLFETNRIEESIEYFKKGIQADPRSAEAYGALGRAYRLQGEPDKALESFQKALELVPGDNQILHQMAQVYLDKGERRRGLDSLYKVLVREPVNIQVHLEVCRVLVAEGNLDEAIAGYLQVLHLDPAHAEARNGWRDAVTKRDSPTTIAGQV